ncbi:hypothetical protein GN244_ATG03002 [Phytophthora infestans]|uniref:Uncharacterized protein n=1 Tax=Phytophthora infestans TaxID=4787 RepID=A0A833SPK7_PHYIN|nr:hypothetical protein GN244_ATG11664 [Phytophthora infestans]KAF4044775.1 hypothetical protein GN244_ATG03002 [Phytophthora infestans]KAF4148062.1 hypothetical protein GN958_ATG02756 [Phytophthora infestans]
MRDVHRMRNKEPVPFVKELLVDENEMDPRCQLIDFQFPTRDSINPSDVHVLALKPEYAPVKWKPEIVEEASLEIGKLYFTNRSSAVKQLQRAHWENFLGATKGKNHSVANSDGRRRIWFGKIGAG